MTESPAIHDPRQDPVARERGTIQSISYLIRTTWVLALACCILSAVPIVIVDATYVEHEVRAGSVPFVTVVLTLAAPGLWVERDPRWRRIGGWMLWVALGVFVAGGRLRALSTGSEATIPEWPRFALYLALALIGVIVLVCLPLARRGNRSPERAPVARVHRGH
jgi:hypothetical protein